jgi:hypothetical protein
LLTSDARLKIQGIAAVPLGVFDADADAVAA